MGMAPDLAEFSVNAFWNTSPEVTRVPTILGRGLGTFPGYSGKSGPENRVSWAYFGVFLPF